MPSSLPPSRPSVILLHPSYVSQTARTPALPHPTPQPAAGVSPLANTSLASHVYTIPHIDQSDIFIPTFHTTSSVVNTNRAHSEYNSFTRKQYAIRFSPLPPYYYEIPTTINFHPHMPSISLLPPVNKHKNESISAACITSLPTAINFHQQTTPTHTKPLTAQARLSGVVTPTKQCYAIQCVVNHTNG